MYSKLLSAIAVLAAAMLPVPAQAADVAIYPIETADDGWTGIRLGVTGGWARSKMRATGVTVGGASIGSLSSALASVGASGATISSITTTAGDPSVLEASGFIGGALAGYDRRFQNWVVGVEADISALDNDDTYSAALAGTLLGVPFTGTGSVTGSIDWLATFRVRAGHLITPKTLIYATGGLAVAGVSSTLTASATAAGVTATVGASDRVTATGYTVGAGVESNFYGDWFARGEYLYVDLGSNTLNYSVAGTAMGLTTDIDAHIARLVLTYRFRTR